MKRWCWVLLVWCSGAALGQPPTAMDGTGKNFGRGYRPDAAGNLHGTGPDFGRGWARHSDGGWRGTGKNFGRGYRPDAAGNLHGTGTDFGRGWAR